MRCLYVCLKVGTAGGEGGAEIDRARVQVRWYRPVLINGDVELIENDGL